MRVCVCVHVSVREGVNVRACSSDDVIGHAVPLYMYIVPVCGHWNEYLQRFAPFLLHTGVTCTPKYLDRSVSRLCCAVLQYD